MPLTKDCSSETKEVMAESAYLRKFSKNEVIVTPETAIHKLAIVASEGRMKISAHSLGGDEYIVYILSYGDIFNVITYLDEEKDHLHATALDDLDILFCNIDIARDWLTRCADFNRNLLKYLAARLKMAQDFNVERTFYNIEIRLARLIFKNIVSNDNQHNLLYNLSHDEIAKILGTTRAVVNRNLQYLKKAKLINIKRKKILIADYEKLQAYIESNTSL